MLLVNELPPALLGALSHRVALHRLSEGEVRAAFFPQVAVCLDVLCFNLRHLYTTDMRNSHEESQGEELAKATAE